MKVSELASRAGVSAKTVRFYEAEGVLPPAPRAGNGYRAYDETDLCRLRLIVALRGLGLDLFGAGQLAQLCTTGRCDEMAGQLLARLTIRRAEVAAAHAELEHLDAELEHLQGALQDGASVRTLCLGTEVDP